MKLSFKAIIDSLILTVQRIGKEERKTFFQTYANALTDHSIKREIIDYERMTAPCGLPCFECLFYLANENKEQRSTIAKKLAIPIELAVCQGCRNEKGKCRHNPMPCNVYPCAERKGVKFCCECVDFPCDYLHPYADLAATKAHNLKVFNLCLIKKMGLEEWAKNKVKSVGEVYFSEKWKL